MFGDILLDEVSMVIGLIGMLFLVFLGDGIFGVYELIYGSVLDIVGMGIVNLLVIIFFIVMMFRYSFLLEKEVKIIENVVLNVFEDGYRIGDIMIEGKIKVGIVEMGDLVCKKIKEGK